MMTTDEPTTRFAAEPGTQSITITREFAATPEQLLRAHTDPALLARWLGPRGLKTEIEAHEPRHGGRYAFTQRRGDDAYAFRGVFHGDPSVEGGIRQTFEFLGVPGEVSFEHVTFERLSDGRTRLTGHSIYASEAVRDAVLQSGMEGGVTVGYERLDELIEQGEL